MSNLTELVRRALLMSFTLLLVYSGAAGVLKNILQGLGSGTNEFRLVGVRQDMFRILGVGLLLAALSWPQLRSQLVQSRSTVVLRWIVSLCAFLLSLMWLLGTLVIATPETETTLIVPASFYALGLGLLTWILAPNSWFRRRMA